MPNASELRELDDEELENRLTEYRREMLNLRFQLATGQLDNIVRLSVVRKDVARVLTIMRDREIALAEGRDAGPVLSTRPARRRAAETFELEDEPIQARRPRRPRAQSSDEVSELADEEDTAIPGGDDDADEEDE